jgi:hypothetical protein
MSLKCVSKEQPPTPIPLTSPPLPSWEGLGVGGGAGVGRRGRGVVVRGTDALQNYHNLFNNAVGYFVNCFRRNAVNWIKLEGDFTIVFVENFTVSMTFNLNQY